MVWCQNDFADWINVDVDVSCDLLQYTHTEQYYLFVLYHKNSNGLLKDFWGMQKEKQVCWRAWRDLTPSVCVSLIDHGQQPMKMHKSSSAIQKPGLKYLD